MTYCDWSAVGRWCIAPETVPRPIRHCAGLWAFGKHLATVFGTVYVEPLRQSAGTPAMEAGGGPR